MICMIWKIHVDDDEEEDHGGKWTDGRKSTTTDHTQIPSSPNTTQPTKPDFKCLIRESKSVKFHSSLFLPLVIPGSGCYPSVFVMKMTTLYRETLSQVLRAQMSPSLILLVSRRMLSGTRSSFRDCIAGFMRTSQQTRPSQVLRVKSLPQTHTPALPPSLCSPPQTQTPQHTARISTQYAFNPVATCSYTPSED